MNEKYAGLCMSETARKLLLNNASQWDANCNGVGSEDGTWWQRLIYHLTPNTIWGMDITPASDIHDNEYTVPQSFLTKVQAENHRFQADINFKTNIDLLTDRAYMASWMPRCIREFLREARKTRAHTYYMILRKQGEESFMANKKIGK